MLWSFMTFDKDRLALCLSLGDEFDVENLSFYLDYFKNEIDLLFFVMRIF